MYLMLEVLVDVKLEVLVDLKLEAEVIDLKFLKFQVLVNLIKVHLMCEFCEIRGWILEV